MVLLPWFLFLPEIDPISYRWRLFFGARFFVLGERCARTRCEERGAAEQALRVKGLFELKVSEKREARALRPMRLVAGRVWRMRRGWTWLVRRSGGSSGEGEPPGAWPAYFLGFVEVIFPQLSVREDLFQDTQDHARLRS